MENVGFRNNERIVKMKLKNNEFDGYFYKSYGGVSYSVKDIFSVPDYIKRRCMGNWKDLDYISYE